jgi:hypothetical protein
MHLVCLLQDALPQVLKCRRTPQHQAAMTPTQVELATPAACQVSSNQAACSPGAAAECGATSLAHAVREVILPADIANRI